MVHSHLIIMPIYFITVCNNYSRRTKRLLGTTVIISHRKVLLFGGKSRAQNRPPFLGTKERIEKLNAILNVNLKLARKGKVITQHSLIHSISQSSSSALALCLSVCLSPVEHRFVHTSLTDRVGVSADPLQ